MKHLKEGEIRAYLDHELETENQRIESHLQECPRCRTQAEVMQLQATLVQEHLSRTAPDSPLSPTASRRAYPQLAARLTENKESQPMWNKFLSRMPRPVWIAILTIIAMSVALAFPPVRAIANSFLGLFRVEQIRVVQVDPLKLPEQLGSSSQFEQMMAYDVQFEGGGETLEVASASEASSVAGFIVQLPGMLQSKPQLRVQPGGVVTYQINLELVKAILEELERSDIQLPEELDGATVSVEIQSVVVAHYGDCEIDAEGMQQAAQEGYDPDDPSTYLPTTCTTLMQTPSPTINAPAGLDITQIGEAYLQVLGMSRQEATNFARNVDWASTFVIPIPGNNSRYQEVQVNGVPGTLITMPGRQIFILLWVKDGILFALNGPGKASQALEIANSIK